jgi:ribosomal protein S20
MENRKKWLVLPIIGGLVVALALGVMAFTPGVAANISQSPLLEEDDTDETYPWKGGFGGFRGFKRGGRFGFGTSFDYDAFIAEELGVSDAELQAARQAAQEAALDQAVAEGIISAEQAELIKAGQALRHYIDHQEILNQALGIDAADLEAAREDGKSLPYLFGELGLEPEEIQAALQSAYEDAIQEAVDDGVITDSQAEQLQENGFGGRGFGMRGFGFHGYGGFPRPGLRIAPDNDI